MKLAELRAKTSRQLQRLIGSKLDLGLSFADQSPGRANQALMEVEKLLPALNEGQRQELSPKLTQLREASLTAPTWSPGGPPFASLERP